MGRSEGNGVKRRIRIDEGIKREMRSERKRRKERSDRENEGVKE